MLKFNFKYFILTALLFFVELYIGLYVHDEIIRPFVGDFLVVILIYCFIKSFYSLSVWTAAITVLIFSYLVEILQYFKIVELLGLKHNKIAKIIIGTTFGWIDLIVYTLGIGLVLFIELMAIPNFIKLAKNNFKKIICMHKQTKSIRSFIGAKNYEESISFYIELGFIESKLSNEMSYFAVSDNLGFYLQNAYVKDWVDNSMIFVEVADVQQYWNDLQKLDLPKKYKNVRLTPIKNNNWGSECFLHDPSGILWHFGAFKK